MSAKSKPRPELILFLACVAIAIAPLVIRGTSCGQDFDFHFESWMGVVRQWNQNVFYPHWIASANYGAGEPRFVFYPPLTWMLGGALSIFLPWTWTPLAFTTLCLIGMGVACYKMASEWMPPETATLAACLYVINPYILFVIYERSALGELLAAAWLPLIVLYALRSNPARAQNLWIDLLTSVPQLALVIALLWLTDAPAAVMGCYALAVLVAVAAVSQRRWTLIARATAGVALGLGLSAFYLIPAIYEQRWVEIDRAITVGMRIQDSFLFEHTGMAYHDQVLRAVSFISVILLAVSLFAATALAAVQFWRSRKSASLYLPFIVLAALIAFLLFPASRILWYAAPELHFLQFPWRWLLVLGLICATFAAEALCECAPFKPGFGLSGESHRRSRFALRATVTLAFAAILITIVWKNYWQTCDDQDNIHAQLATLQQGFEGTDEYTPKPADNGDIQQNLAPVRVVSDPDGDEADSSIAENPDWKPNQQDLLPSIIEIKRWNVEHMTAEIQSSQPGYAVFRLMDYPAWLVRLNNVPIPSGPVRDDGLLTVPIPAGTSTIDVRYTATPDVWAGRAVSFFSLLLWLSVATKSRHYRI